MRIASALSGLVACGLTAALTVCYCVAALSQHWQGAFLLLSMSLLTYGIARQCLNINRECRR